MGGDGGNEQHPYIRYMKLKNRIWQQRRNEESESAIAAVAAGSTIGSARPDGKVVVVQEETTIDVINHKRRGY